MNIRQIEYIIAAKELLHFGRAAQKCFISQSTLSTMIGKFEDEIGIKIFDRSTKPVTVTNEGLLIVEQLEAVIKEVENLKEKVKLMKNDLSGELKIGIIPTVAPYVFPGLLYGFVAKYPRVHFSISELTTGAILEKLRERRLDLGILATPLHNANMVEHPLYNEEFVVYDNTQKKACGTVTIDEIDFSQFWLLEESHCFSSQVVKICDLKNRATAYGSKNFEFKAGAIDSLIRLIKESGNGITFLPYLATLELSPSDKKKVMFFEKKDVPLRTISIVVHRHFVKKQIVELLKAEIKSTITPLLRCGLNNNRVILPL